MLLLLSMAARAAGLSGLSVPEPLGAWAGPGAEGALGLASTPAAARPSSLSGVVDLGLIYNHYTYQLDGERPVSSGGISPAPSLAVAAPLGPLGLGVAVTPPFVRGGAGPGEDAPGRYHLGDSNILVLEANPSLAGTYQTLTVGAGLRVASVRFASRLQYDTAVLMNDLLADDTQLPYQDPFLEGHYAYDVRGVGWGGTLGLRWRPARGPALDLAWRSPLRARVSGPMTLVPSDDLALEIAGVASGEFVFPMEVLASARVPVGSARLGGELVYTAWSSLNTLQTSLHDLAVTSPDPTFEMLLDSYGLTDQDLLDGLGEVTIASGLSDILSGAVYVDAPLGGFSGRLGLWITPAAIPLAYVHPGNVDFGTADLRLGLARQVGPVGLGLAADLFLSAPREVTDSVYASDADAHSGLALPPGEGTYALRAARLGLTAVLAKKDGDGPPVW